QLLYLLSKHFPDRATRAAGKALDAVAAPIAGGRYNTLSSAYAILALDAYAHLVQSKVAGDLSVTEIGKDGQEHALDLPQSVTPMVAFSDKASKLRFQSTSDLESFYVVAQGGFDTTPPTQPIKQDLEIIREYTAADGKPLDKVKLGDEIEVHVKLRALG